MIQSKITTDVKKFVRDNLLVDLSLDGTSSSPKTKRKLQHIVSIKHPEPDAQVLYETLIGHAVHAERECPGAGVDFLKLFSDFKDDSKISHIRTREDLVGKIRSLDVTKVAQQLLLCALDNSTNSTKLSIKKSSSSHTYVDVVEGYSFSIKSLLHMQHLDLKDVKVACIDGYIESVSEIHHLLTYLSEARRPCLLIVRGMSDEVLHTIKVNSDRKTVLVFPYVVPFDPENVNTIVDIAVVSGTDVISSTKGDLISSLKVDKLGTIESCLASRESLRIKNSKTRRRVLEHVAHLKKTLEERPEIENILSARLKSLSSSCIDICIPDDMNFYSMSQQLDEGIRVMTAVLTNKYDPKRVATKIFESFQNSFRDTEMFTS